MMKLFLLCIVAMALVVLLLSVRVLLRRDGRFPSSHVGSQKPLRDKGISCHTSQHREAQMHRNLAERLDLRD